MSDVDQIKSRLGIADVVGRYIELKPAGRSMKAVCPFHNEKSPSFFVSPERDTFHCFGCGVGGDIFSFVQEFEGVDFFGSLKILADLSGVSLSSGGDASARSEKERLFFLLETSAVYFEMNFSKNSDALAYIKERGISDETRSAFRIGYAEPVWRGLSAFLRTRGFSDLDMEKSGMCIRSPKGLYDRFRGRVMFPITDSSGRIIAFSGRILDDALDKQGGKYVNSPDTMLYDKSRVLFGFDKAKFSIRKERRAVLVEGQFDLVLSHQAGVCETVAVSGTALTPEHLAIIKRLSEKIVFAFDADDAGISAAGRGLEMALMHGFDARVVPLPAGKDPADCVKESGEEWKKKTENAVHIVDFYLDYAEKKEHLLRERRLLAERLALPFIARISGSIDRAHFAGEFARRLAISEESVWEALERIVAKGAAAPALKKTLVSEKKPAAWSRREKIERSITGFIAWQKELGREKDLADLIEKYLELVGQDALLPQTEESSVRELVFEAEALFGENAKAREGVSNLLRDLEEELLRKKFAEAFESLRQAEMVSDPEQSAVFLRECQIIQGRIQEIRNFKK
ncbi:DNA primase [bacterium]|nr:DNA primase [bacterium]